MTDTLPLADTSDMLGVHKVFREALAAAPQLAGSVPAADTARAELVASYYDNVLRLLHAHHEGEDALLTPRLLARCTPDESDTVSRVAGQHETVLGSLERAEGLLAAWRAAPNDTTARSLVAALGELEAALGEHLGDEERLVLPIAARYINVAEWGELPGHAMQNFTGDKLWLILGLVQQQMTDAQVADMHAHMPPPLLQFWNESGRGLFEGYVAELHG
jgi:hypothetical protein